MPSSHLDSSSSSSSSYSSSMSSSSYPSSMSSSASSQPMSMHSSSSSSNKSSPSDSTSGDDSHSYSSSKRSHDSHVHSEKKRRIQLSGLGAALFYGLVSICITFFNKAVLSSYKFPYSNALTLAQMLFSTVFMYFLKLGGIIDVPDFRLNTAQQVLPLSVCFMGMVVTGLAGLHYVSIPVFGTLRRLTTFIVMGGQMLLLGKSTPIKEQQSIYVMVGGAILAGWGDMSFSFVGYVLIFANCAVTAGYLLFIPKIKNETSLSEMGLMFYNNVLSMPLVFFLMVTTELSELHEFPYWSDIGFLFCFAMSVVLAFLLNLAIFMCSTINEPLVTSVTGQIKVIVTTGLGLVLFHDVEYTHMLAIGLLTSFL
eukprot:CAMPEP_0174233358 /NCGR_PEP_ID=MMETSP0417-20130205/3421_1 /TAXON_ID=242541 /ORGANISM="Mayorella sp, Strain BSH-02190019" /LENGTH=366 /DNA_ID=CAMNT_0015311559 /DNA_START=119 /DNA_END=1215 /DNA_ORIENTATION=+